MGRARVMGAELTYNDNVRKYSSITPALKYLSVSPRYMPGLLLKQKLKCTVLIT